jgi:hypothetical protein
MPQTTLIEPGTDAITSSDVVVASGARVKISMFSTAGQGYPHGAIRLLERTPGAPNELARLSNARPSVAIDGPATVYVERLASTGQSFGVMLET